MHSVHAAPPLLPLQEDPVAHLFLKKMVQFEAVVERQLAKAKEGGSGVGGGSKSGSGSGSGSVSGEKGQEKEEELIDVSLWEEDEQPSGSGGGANGGGASGGRRQSLARALVAQLTAGGQGGVKGTESS